MLQRRALIVGFVLIVFVATSCINIDQVIFPPVLEIAPSGSEALWLITYKHQLVRVSSDGTSQTVNTAPTPARIIFLNESFGWLIDLQGWVWSTADGGNNWTKRGSHPELGSGSRQILFVDEQNGWLLSYFRIFTTSDGGDTWSSVYPDATGKSSKADGEPTCIYAPTPDVAWVGFTNGFVARTDDRGRTWTVTNVYGKRGPDLGAIYGRDAKTAWVGPASRGGDGLRMTSDGGKTWKPQIKDLEEMNFGRSSLSVRDGVLWLSGMELLSDASSKEPPRPVLFRSEDGKVWTRSDASFLKAQAEQIAFADRNDGWILATHWPERKSEVYRTDDGGKTWRKLFELNRDNGREE